MKHIFQNWHFDLKSALLGLFSFFVGMPLILACSKIIKSHIRQWVIRGLDGILYWISRYIRQRLAATLTFKRYCRLQLNSQNRYLHVPSTIDVELDIDRIFVTLTMENPASDKEIFTHKDVISAGSRLRVVGDPGSGKSSLVKRLFRDLCEEGIIIPSKSRFPVYIQLKDLIIPSRITKTNKNTWLLDFIRTTIKDTHVFQVMECFDSYIETSGTVILLDGLDEVSSKNIEEVHRAITNLSRRLNELSENNIIILTMRTQYHQQVKDLFRDTFGPILLLKPFSPTDIYTFLTRWPFNNKREENISRIYKDLTDRPTLRDMCRNPLVLSMYVADDQTSSNIIAPESRTEFYKKIIEELLIRRRLKQTGPAIAPSKLREQREKVLGRLAFEHILDNTQPANSLRWDEAIRITSDVFACTNQEAIIIFRDLAKETGLITEERIEQSLRFIHLTLCEYLAAYESINGQEEGWKRLIEKHHLNTIKDGYSRSRLIEIIPFACGLMQRIDKYKAIIEVENISDNMLLARCFLETKIYDHPVWPNFVQNMHHELLNTPEEEWNEKWLEDLHLFNVVIRDANLCSEHSPVAGGKVDVNSFYQMLFSQQRESIKKLLSAYATQDAAAAFRVAEICNINLLQDYPEIIINNCDQEPFFALIKEEISKHKYNNKYLSLLFAEAGLRSSLVANRLAMMKPINYLDYKIKKSDSIWNRLNFIRNSYYSQCLDAMYEFNTDSSVFKSINLLKHLPKPDAFRIWFFISSCTAYLFMMSYFITMLTSFTLLRHYRQKMLVIIIVFFIIYLINIIIMRKKFKKYMLYRILLMGFPMQSVKSNKSLPLIYKNAFMMFLRPFYIYQRVYQNAFFRGNIYVDLFRDEFGKDNNEIIDKLIELKNIS